MTDATGDLEPFARALAAELDDELIEWEPVPDLAAVVERAGELAPHVVGPELVADARRQAIRVVADPPWQHPTVVARHWRELAPFRADLRQALDAQLHGRERVSAGWDAHGELPVLRPASRDAASRTQAGRIPSSRTQAGRTPSSRILSSRIPAGRRWIRSVTSRVGVGLVACGLLVWFGATWSGSAGRDKHADTNHAASMRAQQDEAGLDEATVARSRLRSSSVGRLRSDNDEFGREEVEDSPDLAAPAALDAPDLVEPAPPRSDKATAGSQPPVASPSIDERIERLDAKARQQWSRGRLSAAEKTLREIVRIGGRRARVELAYGDLFTLLRQRNHTRELDVVWRRYLESFPRGRFAQDARAGRCHVAMGRAAADCWRDYLRFHPQGAHRVEARRAIERSE